MSHTGITHEKTAAAMTARDTARESELWAARALLPLTYSFRHCGVTLSPPSLSYLRQRWCGNFSFCSRECCMKLFKFYFTSRIIFYFFVFGRRLITNLLTYYKLNIFYGNDDYVLQKDDESYVFTSRRCLIIPIYIYLSNMRNIYFRQDIIQKNLTALRIKMVLNKQVDLFFRRLFAAFYENLYVIPPISFFYFFIWGLVVNLP